MNPQDVNSMAQTMQAILTTLQDTHAQLIDMRGENNQLMAEIKAISTRMDQKDTNIMKLIEGLRAQIQISDSDVNSVRHSVESNRSHIDSKMSELKTAVHEVRNKVN